MNFKRNRKGVIDKMSARLSDWKSKSISIGGKITLIKAVLGSLPTYYLSLYRAPINAIDSLERVLMGKDG